MQAAAFAGQQRVIDGLLRQRMAKDKAICRCFTDQLGGDQRFKQVQEGCLVLLRQLLKKRKITLPPEQCGQGQQFVCGWAYQLGVPVKLCSAVTNSLRTAFGWARSPESSFRYLWEVNVLDYVAVGRGQPFRATR